MRWGVVLPAVLVVASCDEPNVHILTAQLYDPAGACVGQSDGVDVVQGPSTGDACNPSCLTITSGSTTSVYVTTVCPPFPQDYTVEGEDAAAEAGVSAAVGVRWFREGGGMPTVTLAPLSGRYLSFIEREEIALLRAQGCGVREIARQLGRSLECPGFDGDWGL